MSTGKRRPERKNDGLNFFERLLYTKSKKKTGQNGIAKFFSSLRPVNIRYSIYNSLLAKAKKNFDNAAIEKYEAKIDSLNDVKSNVLVRYIARELFVYFFICFIFFFVIFFVNQILLLAETILKQRVPVGNVIRLIIYCLPSIVAQSSPFATLLGFLMCLGRMVTDNEILILRASGQRYSIILIPVLAMGLAISLFSFVMNDYFLPLGTLKYNKMRTQIIQSDPAVQIEANSIKRMSGTSLVIGNANDNEVDDLVIFDRSNSDEDRIIVAGKSSVEKSHASGILMDLLMNDPVVIILKRGEINALDVIRADDMQLNMFESSISSSSAGTDPREMTSYDLGKVIKKMIEDGIYSKRQLNNYKLEYHKKFSIPFGAIFFAILAFPLALVFGKRNGLTLGFIFGIIISVFYWAMTIMGQLFGLRGGYNGFWMVWTPNFVVGVVGIYLYFRLKKK